MGLNSKLPWTTLFGPNMVSNKSARGAWDDWHLVHGLRQPPWTTLFGPNWYQTGVPGVLETIDTLFMASGALYQLARISLSLVALGKIFKSFVLKKAIWFKVKWDSLISKTFKEHYLKRFVSSFKVNTYIQGIESGKYKNRSHFFFPGACCNNCFSELVPTTLEVLITEFLKIDFDICYSD